MENPRSKSLLKKVGGKMEYMKRALELAEIAYKNNEIPVGAVIVLNDKIIAEGFNNREGSNDVLGHAEIIAVLKATKKLNT